jgi:hypothetical protein
LEIPNTEQQARALLALRCDTLRQLDKDRKELIQEINMLEKCIKRCYDESQMDIFEQVEKI